MPKATLVLTTIFDPVILDAYRRNFERYGHLEELDVIVIPDRKTPPAAFETCSRLARQGLNVVCPALEEQEAFLKRVGLPSGFIPYNLDNRRNVGFLMAWERGSDFLISIDDDNFCSDDEDYFAAHAGVLFGREAHLIAGSDSRFLNICDLLQISVPSVYARGYPYFARHESSAPRTRAGAADVMINAGLWLQDPDVDAMTWLQLHPTVTGFMNQSVVLDAGTWSPVNSQNTAVRRDVLPAYYFIRMGYPLHGSKVDRYGDIFSGYFALACAKHLGGSARFGTPIADHRRNSHNYLKDAAAELPAILLLEDILTWLIDTPLCGSTGLEAYLSLSHLLEEAVEKFQGQVWTDSSRGFVHQMAHLMRVWIAACRVAGGSETTSGGTATVQSSRSSADSAGLALDILATAT
ncbi:MAG: hypothetical protein ABSE42_05855 [Bryobacteraceae bacterium]|jgi:hypothetical protein